MPGGMSYQQAAKWLGVSKSTLERLVAEGAIRPAYVRRRVLFTEQMLETFLEKCSQPLLSKRRGNGTPKASQAKGKSH